MHHYKRGRALTEAANQNHRHTRLPWLRWLLCCGWARPSGGLITTPVHTYGHPAATAEATAAAAAQAALEFDAAAREFRKTKSCSGKAVDSLCRAAVAYEDGGDLATAMDRWTWAAAEAKTCGLLAMSAGCYERAAQVAARTGRQDIYATLMVRAAQASGPCVRFAVVQQRFCAAQQAIDACLKSVSSAPADDVLHRAVDVYKELAAYAAGAGQWPMAVTAYRRLQDLGARLKSPDRVYGAALCEVVVHVLNGSYVAARGTVACAPCMFASSAQGKAATAFLDALDRVVHAYPNPNSDGVQTALAAALDAVSKHLGQPRLLDALVGAVRHLLSRPQR